MSYNDALPLAGSQAEAGLGIESQETALARYATVEDMVKNVRPAQPVHCLHPENLDANAALFLKNFPGKAFYAVKVNPDPYVLQRLYAAGVRHFDVASLAEVQLVRRLFPEARTAFMHPVKSRESISMAYFDYGIRDFSVDTFEELHKILEETKAATDLAIHVRLATPKTNAAFNLSEKFGAQPDDAVSLLRDAEKVAHKVGLCFHVGSQTSEPESYAHAIQLAGEVIRKSGVALDVLDVGGGFPASYPGMETPPVLEYFDVIKRELAKLKLPKTCEVWSEPGRAIVASAGTLVVRVELRRGGDLYINDGTYGSLFDAGWMKWLYPVQIIRRGRRNGKGSKNLQPFRFYGPSCDSVDVMNGPFMLPEDICEGDWIAISQMGAYGHAMQTRFNGFYSDHRVEINPTAPPVTRRRAPKLTVVRNATKSAEVVEQ